MSHCGPAVEVEMSGYEVYSTALPLIALYPGLMDFAE